MTFPDHFSDKARQYASARPLYPRELYEFVASVAPGRERVWDCGTGNGQAAEGLASFFKTVSATDPSAEQISNAPACSGVEYTVQPAEKTTFPAATFDALCVAQALHWFDYERFYPEAFRVLKPNGVIVAWGYDWFKISPEFDEMFMKSILSVIRPYWAPQNSLLWDGYRNIPFPFFRIETPKFEIEVLWDYHQLLSYVQTWSATKRCISKQGDIFFEQATAGSCQIPGCNFGSMSASDQA